MQWGAIDQRRVKETAQKVTILKSFWIETNKQKFRKGVNKNISEELMMKRAENEKARLFEKDEMEQ